MTVTVDCLCVCLSVWPLRRVRCISPVSVSSRIMARARKRAMPHARLACLLLILAPAGALALHTGVRAPLPAATRRAALRLAADEAVGKEEDTEAADAGFNWPLLVAGTGTALGTGIHWPAFTQFVSQWQDIANSGVTGDDFTAPLQFWVRPSHAASLPRGASPS